MPLSDAQIYQYARAAGFPPATAVKMVAIALRESGGNPMAYNGVPPDMSYGLWQINMLGALGPARRAQFGITDNSQLFDPATSARAAAALWGGNDANLTSAWYINRSRPGEPDYKGIYESFLPRAMAAQAQVEGGYVDPGMSAPLPTPGDGTLGDVDMRWVLGGVAAAAVLYLVIS